MPLGNPSVAIIMGSQSDWATMKHAADTLDALDIPYEARIVSAHRTPERMVEFAQGAKAEGFKVIIAGAGGAAHLPGMVAAMTHLPVLGVPVQSKALSGQDSLLSIVQMPAGIPVGTLAIGEAGATNAGLLAAAILATNDDALAGRLKAYRAAQSAGVAERPATDPEFSAADNPKAPGWDAKAISRVASDAYGGLLAMYEKHGWPERGSEMMQKVQARVKEAYGSVEEFVARHRKN